jgi:hypothetical protein
LLPHSRRLLITVAAIALVSGALASSGAAPALAGGSCTGWTSITEPPPTIRVGRPDGRVQVVDFYKYVAVVMAREWSPTHPPATLEAGAVAAKQYGWYYTLAGKWRTSYVNAEGKCYDVTSTTADQLYQPEKVGTVDPRFWAAVSATWGLTLRKSDRFFLTGYRAGDAVPCASDANGWKLFAKSAIDCGRKGWSRERIQLAYYAPDVTFHWMGGESAAAKIDIAISAPDVTLITGGSLGKVVARLAWDREAARPEGTTYQLQQLLSGDWRTIALADPIQPFLDIRLRPGKTNQFRVRLRDAENNTSAWYTGQRYVPRLVQNPSSAFTWSPREWRKGWTSKASGGSLGYSWQAGAVATFTFTGTEVALVGTHGPERGATRIWVDGVFEAEIDMYADADRWRALYFTRRWEAAGTHVIGIEVVGTESRPRIDVDAALYLP